MPINRHNLNRRYTVIILCHDQIHMYTQKRPEVKKKKNQNLNLFSSSLKVEKGAYFLKKKKIPHLILVLIREPSLSVLTAD